MLWLMLSHLDHKWTDSLLLRYMHARGCEDAIGGGSRAEWLKPPNVLEPTMMYVRMQSDLV